MNETRILLVTILIFGYWMLAQAFDPKDGYPRSKYSRRRDNITVDTSSNEETEEKNELDESDFANVYECGAQTAENHPWIAVLEHTDPTGKSKKRTLSKGVLIGPQHVLTTVSSIHNSHPFWVVSGVRLGDSPTWAIDNMEHNSSRVVRRDIEEVYIHEKKDIALIKLTQRVKITDNIKPICLPKQGHYEFRELHLHICKRIKGVPLKKQARIIVAQVTPVAPHDCTIMFQRQHATVTPSEFCAWDENGDTCTGDLGGPVIGKHNGRFYVTGLKSYALTSMNLNEDAMPGVYTKVGSHIKWIRELMNNNV
uniref:CSON009640 protein n=2 Tax=Culicoides sonorensis TaxID=179676 RepID=A0A336N033_CULSO